MISPFFEITNHSSNNLQSFLKERELWEIFEPILKEFGEAIFPGVVKFILYGYSIESEVLHSTGITWETMSKVIYQKAKLPNNEDLFERIANLKDATVQDVITKWLDFQNNENFTDYINARDLRKHCLQVSKNADRMKDRMEAVKNAKECLQMMEEAKSKFVENYDIMKPSLSALKKAKKNTLGPQDYAS